MPSNKRNEAPYFRSTEPRRALMEKRKQMSSKSGFSCTKLLSQFDAIAQFLHLCTAIVAKRCYLRNCSILCQNLVSRAEIVQFGETGEGAIVIGESNALRIELIRTNWNYLCKNLSHFIRIWKCLIFKLAQQETNWNLLQLSIDM